MLSSPSSHSERATPFIAFSASATDAGAGGVPFAVGVLASFDTSARTFAAFSVRQSIAPIVAAGPFHARATLRSALRTPARPLSLLSEAR